VEATNDLLGTDLDRDRMASLLESIEFKVENDDEGALRVTVPSFRVDVTRPGIWWKKWPGFPAIIKFPPPFLSCRPGARALL
jgi:hypothetical protein